MIHVHFQSVISPCVESDKWLDDHPLQVELERLLRKNAAIREELASENPIADQEISPEWYQLCVVHVD